MTAPLVSSQVFDAFPLACILAWFVLAIVFAIRAWWISRRNEQQIEDELRMRIGMKGCRSRGWLPEDLQ